MVEAACVELRDGCITGAVWHSYFNPEREVPAEAVMVHGLTEAFLKSAPLFKDKVREFLDFVAGARLIAHNASFDLGFFNAELGRSGLPPLAAM